MSRATEDALGALHGLIADALKEQIEAARASGEGIPPALLAQAIKFLKDNGIDAPEQAGGRLDRLKKSLPSAADLEDNVTPFRR